METVINHARKYFHTCEYDEQITSLQVALRHKMFDRKEKDNI